jgi:PRTRC genetic system ThiF family protein
VAEGLCRILANSNLDLLLIDHDRVEPHNLRRQSFFEGDVGKFKSQVLAERLARQYGRKIGYSVYPYERGLLDERGALGVSKKRGVIIGCVDTPHARKAIHDSIDWGDWWLDAGNGYQSGQVLIGNTKNIDGLQEAFDNATQSVDKLPLPSLQLPSLLMAPAMPATVQQDCAEAVEQNSQSPVINQAMATLVLQFVNLLLTMKLTWMGAYLDLNAGTLQTVPADPITIARMFSVKVDTLYAELKCSIGHRYRLQERR